MPDTLQLRSNKLRIQPETVLADGGDDTDVLDCRLTGASATRQAEATQERTDPWRNREFTSVVHQAWNLSASGEARSGGFLRWLVSKIGTAGTAERGLDVFELLPHDSQDPTFAIQVDGLEGTSTFVGAALTKIALQFRGKSPILYTLEFAALAREDDTAWTTTATEAGDMLTTAGGQLALATDLAADPDSNTITGYEAAIQIERGGRKAANFSPDGVARGHTDGEPWDVTGRILLPEAAGITDTSMDAVWNGEINLRAGSASGDVFEIEAGIVAGTTGRTAIADDWKQAGLDFVSRRASGEAIARFLTDQPAL